MMIGQIVRLFVRYNLSLRYLFWKTVLKINGGSVGQNVRIYEGAKLALRKGCPIDIGNNVSIEKGVVISTSEKRKDFYRE